MKKYLTLGLVACALQAAAVDRIVEEFGVPPTFPSITAAIAAAEDGDRIIIKNRAGDIPWIETINVNKSLEFLSFQDNGFFIVQGNWTLTAASNRQIRIIGMRNTSGNIVTAGSSALAGTRVAIIDCQFVAGNIQLNNDNFKVDVIGNEFLNGYIHISFGNVIGNKVTNPLGVNLVRVDPTNVVFQNDTAAVVGNEINGPSTSAIGIFVRTRAQVAHVRNNLVRHANIGIYASQGNTGGVPNLVWNNTVVATGGSSPTAISMTSTLTGSVWEVMNNVLTFSSGTNNRGIFNGGSLSGQTNVYYNVVESSMGTTISATGFTFVGNNITNFAVDVEADGTLPPSSPAIDGGNPAPPFFDLDLSPGDAGAYGGSYTLDNFFPLHTGAARVYMAGHPYNIRQGATLRVKANAWDR